MKAGVRVNLLKEYETIKMKSLGHSYSIWEYIAGIAFLILFCGIAILTNSVRMVSIALSVCIPLFIVHTIIFIIMNNSKKKLLSIQEVLGSSEEEIYDEINTLDIQEKEQNVIREN